MFAKRLLSFVLLLSVLSGIGCFSISAENSTSTVFPETVSASVSVSAPVSVSASVSAQSAVLMDGNNGWLLYEKCGTQRLPMASTTKIMTAFTALRLADPETPIQVAPEAVGIEGSSVYLVAGEQLTLEELLYALLLESANDAAVAIAYGLCGSVESFADRMNNFAAELGLTDTHFTNPHGLDNEQHYTSAVDLARIAAAALQIPLFEKIVSTRKATIPHAGTPDMRLLVNHNKLLRLYPDVIGIKTGFTKRSGRCLVSAAKQNGVTLICVTLNAPNDWNDHRTLLDAGFDCYVEVPLCSASEFSVTLPVVGGTLSAVTLQNTQSLTVRLPKNHGTVTQTVESQRFFFAPLSCNDAHGQVVFFCDIDGNGTTEILGSVPLYSTESVEKITTKFTLWEWICSLFK